MKMTPTPVQDLEIEKLKLEIEKQKLENQKLQLQLQLQSLESNDATGKGTEPKESGAELKSKPNEENKDQSVKDRSKSSFGRAKVDAKELALEVSGQAEELAQKTASEEKTIVLDFTNGEIWYKGVRYPLSFITQLYEDQKWNSAPKFLKYSIGGDSRMRYGHENFYVDRYLDDKIGVFVYQASDKPGSFSFVTPEGVTQDSGSGVIRNRFETAFFTFDNKHMEKDLKVLRFKHVHDMLSFDDVLEFWFDKNDKLVEVKWGLLDKQ